MSKVSVTSILLLSLSVSCQAQNTLAPQKQGSAPWFVRRDPQLLTKLSQPQFPVTFRWDVKITMRDGIKLSANIWRPQAEGKFPVILMFTPYDNALKAGSVIADVVGHANYFAPRGYAVVGVDNRGRYDSEGIPYFYWHTNWREGGFEGLDVYDCLTWLADQPWSSGKIGMTGGSYLGFVQWLVAYLQHPALATIIPYVSPDDHHDNFFPGGAFRLSAGLHTLTILSGRDNKPGLASDFWNWPKLYRHLPLRDFDEAMLGKKVPFWQDFMDHPDKDEYWRFSVGEQPRVAETGPGKYDRVRIPTLNVSGWYDTMQQPVINNYLGMVRHGPPALRNKHQLIIGPWFHEVAPRKLGDLDYGADAAVDFLMVELRWYDRWLKGIENGIADEPPVNVFVMGRNAWRTGAEWPLAASRERKYQLHSRGHANTRFGDGRLELVEPGDEPPDTFTYDPSDPVPTYGGNTRSHPLVIGPKDQRALQERKDVLVYTTAPLDEEIEVTGRVLAKLYAASTAPDTDFTAKLLDVHPDGYAQILKDGIIRARYSESFSKPRLLTPGQVYAYTIDLWSVSHVFKKDHRIQVEISSSNFPKYDRNPNTGHKFGEDSQLEKANQRIFHSSKYPSHILLPVVR